MSSQGILTIKQRLFVEAYIETRNGTEAARRAGYAGDDNVLGVQAHDNLRNPKIKEQIERRIKPHIISANEVLRELSDIATADWRDFVQVKYGKDGKVIHARLALGDKLRALELSGKHHKLFTDKVETSTPNDDIKRELFEQLIERFGLTPERAEQLIELDSELTESLT